MTQIKNLGDIQFHFYVLQLYSQSRFSIFELFPLSGPIRFEVNFLTRNMKI